MDTSLNIEWFVSDKIGILNSADPVESPEVRTQLEHEDLTQVVTIRPWPFTMAWKLPDCNLRNFMFRMTDPFVLSPQDLFQLSEFCVYELSHHRRVPIWFEDIRAMETVVAAVRRFFASGLLDLDHFLIEAMDSQRNRLAQLPKEPHQLSGCCYCHDGLCHRDLVCHTTDVESAVGIIRSGRILSACKARDVSGEEMARDSRNAAGDPPDYFEYVMWGSGNCTALDKLVFERVVGHVPSWEEFEVDFHPGVRFFFRNEDLQNYPGLIFDGIHEKIHEELALDPYLVLVVIPEGLTGSDALIERAHHHLAAEKVISFPFAGMHYKDWARMVYREALTKVS